MQLVLVEDKRNLLYRKLTESVKEDIDICNQVIKELIDPILDKNYLKEEIKITYKELRETQIEQKIFHLATIFQLDITKDMFKAIQKELKENKKEVAFLNNMPMDMVLDYINNTHYLKYDYTNLKYIDNAHYPFDIYDLIYMIETLIKEGGLTEKFDKELDSVYDTWLKEYAE